MTSSYCFCVLEYILLITIDPFFHSLSINCIICLFRSSPLFVYTYFIRVPARKNPRFFLYCCTPAGMIQSGRENADKIRLHLFYWGHIRRFFNHEKEIGCARRSGGRCRHPSRRMRRFQERRRKSSSSAWKPEKDVKIIVAYKAGSGTDTGARLLANSAKKYVGHTLVIENKPGADGKSAGRNSPRANRTDTP